MDSLTNSNTSDTSDEVNDSEDINGTPGDDVIHVPEGTISTVNGGDGFDTVIFTTDGGGGFGSDVEILFGFEDNDFDEFLIFSSTPELMGLLSDDTNLTFTSIERVQIIDSESGLFTIYQVSGLEGEVIDLSNDSAVSTVIVGGGGDDTIIAPDISSVNFLFGGDGDDIITSGNGFFDFIFGNGGVDILTGGEGPDRFSYFTETLSGSFSDTITDFSEQDSIVFNSFSDAPIAPPEFISSDAFSGMAGELRSFAADGQTFLELDIDGDAVADEVLTISSGEFNIQVEEGFSSGDITLRGTSIGGTINDDDIDVPAGEIDFDGRDGNDEINIVDGTTGSIDGGDGFDTVDIRTSEALSVVTDNGVFDLEGDLSGLDSSQFITGIVNTETGEQILHFTSIERLTVITSGPETLNFSIQLFGTEDDNILVPNFNSGTSFVFGNDGNDIITDLGGASSIFGGAGEDILTGGEGANEFSFFADSLLGGFSDTITDFTQLDTIHIASADGGGLAPDFIDDAMFSGSGNELRSQVIDGQTLLELDIDGDGVADETLTILNDEFDIGVVTGNGNGLSLRGTPIGPAVTPGFDYTTEFIDTIGIEESLLADLEAVAETALSTLSGFISAVDGASLDVTFTIASSGDGSIASAMQPDFVIENAFFNEDAGFFEVPVVPQVEFSQGIDANGSAPDINITINSDFLLGGQAFLGTDPDRVVPGLSIDYVSTVIHEIVHGLGFASLVNLEGNRPSLILDGNSATFLDFDADGRSDIFDTTFGANVTFEIENGALIPRFSGENLVDVFGEAIVLENVSANRGSQINHFAEVNPDGSIAEAMDSIESTFANFGSIRPLDAITLAVLQDLGFVITVPDDTPLVSPNDTDTNVIPTLSTNIQIMHDDQGQPSGLAFSLEDGSNLDQLASLAVEITAGDGVTTQVARVRFTGDNLQPILILDQEFLEAHLGSSDNTISIRQFSGFDLIIDNENSEQSLVLEINSNGVFNGTDGEDILNGADGNDLLLGDQAVALPSDSIEGQVYRAFQIAFDRAPDIEGFNAFVTELRAGNLTELQVISELVSSPEFQQIFGIPNNMAFVEQLFRNAFDREGDPEGIAQFTAALDTQTLTREQVVLEFANSPEFLQLTTLQSAAFATNVTIHPAEAQVFRIYQAVFQRDPDEGGFTAFTNSLQSGVLTVESITAEFVSSAEFQSTYGALSNAEFVELLFTNVLPGNTDVQGRADFTDALNANTLTRAGIVAEFVESFEFVQRMDVPAAEFVASVFTSSSDLLDGGSGNDILFGGRGDDEFIFDTENGDQDIIMDFTTGVDTIDLGVNTAFDSFAEIIAVATQSNLDTVFDFGGGNTLTLANTALADLTAGDFGFGSSVSAVSRSIIDATLIAGQDTVEVDAVGLDSSSDAADVLLDVLI